jgi:hypothetical protein
MLLEAERLRSLPDVPLLLHLLEGLVVQRLRLHPLQQLEVVYLNYHALAHPHVR